MDLSDLRKEYSQRGLHEADLASDPFVQFQRWFDDACAEASFEPNAMIVATVNAAGHPSARTVLLKGFDQRGFTFFTNYTSRKGEDLSVSPYAALLFYWAPLERQVRIEGSCMPIATDESDAYYASRPLGSQLGAWASPQSQVIADRSELEERLATVTERFANAEVPRPPHWGGYRVMPSSIEFWQGRPSRLHDRLIYQRNESGWTIQRLAP